MIVDRLLPGDDAVEVIDPIVDTQEKDEMEGGDLDVHGIDLLEFDTPGRISTLTIVIRPLAGLIALEDAMTVALTATTGDGQ
jgi:hypothetical protein